jgi:hypothetical protein
LFVGFVNILFLFCSAAAAAKQHIIIVKWHKGGKLWANAVHEVDALYLNIDTFLVIMAFFRKLSEEKGDFFEKKVVESGKMCQKGLLLNSQ